jgi:glycosyltransferase involved in cell wall biosynthesis
MHVLHLVQLYRPVPSGAARYFVEIGERLVREGHRVTVLTTDAFDLEHLWSAGHHRIEAPEDSHNGVRVLRFPITRLPGSPLLYPVIRRLMVELALISGQSRRVVGLLQHMARLTPRLPTLLHALHHDSTLQDVALVHSTNITLDFAILPVLAWAQQRGIPHICTPFVHLGEPRKSTIVRYYTMPHQVDILRRSAAVITQTDLERRFLQRAGVPDQQMHTIGVGVDPQEIAGGDGQRFRQQYHISGPLVLTLGVAAHDKGTLHVVQAMQRLWARGCAATWVQVGPQLRHFQRFFATLPERDKARCRLPGFVPAQVRNDALAAADMLVLPSRTDSFGIVYLEAWCYGLPVIGAWAGGVPEVVRHGTNGLLVPFGDVTALADAIHRLLRDQTLARALGAVGRNTVLRSLTWEHRYRQVRDTCAQVIAPAPPGKPRG